MAITDEQAKSMRGAGVAGFRTYVSVPSLVALARGATGSASEPATAADASATPSRTTTVGTNAAAVE